jgi:hypothetical protein
MEEKRLIQTDSWFEYSDIFISGNRGRTAILRVKPEGENKQIIAKEIPLLNLVIDPIDKGDVITIALGHGMEVISHKVYSPIEIIESFNPQNGQIVSLEFQNKDFEVTELVFH